MHVGVDAVDYLRAEALKHGPITANDGLYGKPSKPQTRRLKFALYGLVFGGCRKRFGNGGPKNSAYKAIEEQLWRRCLDFAIQCTILNWGLAWKDRDPKMYQAAVMSNGMNDEAMEVWFKHCGFI